MGFDIDSYVKVNERIKQFRDMYPQGALVTKVTELADGILISSLALRDSNERQEFALTGIASATGHAFLAKSDIGGDKVLEYCESVSLGRCLAILGFSVEKSIASAEEMDRYNAGKESRKSKIEPKAKETKPFNFNKKPEPTVEVKPVETPVTVVAAPVETEVTAEETQPIVPSKLKSASKFKIPKRADAQTNQ